MSTILATHQLAIGYKNTGQATSTVLDGITVTLHPGELTCLIGPNGAGKSTLMRTLAGMQAPLTGHVTLGKDELHRLPPAQVAKQLAVVLTERVEVGNLSAYALVALGRHPYTDWRGRLRAQDELVVRHALITVGAAHLAARPVSRLSDGERQKVMIARALAQEPSVLILDEPTAFLDLPRRVEIMQLLHTLARKGNRAILLSTHDLDLALRMADRLWLLPTGGPLTVGLPEELALNGSLAQAFRGEGVEFDNEQGAFKVQRHSSGLIGLTGHGAAALWTARALERLGYEVVNEKQRTPIQVHIAGSNGSTRWQVTNHDGSAEYKSLAEVIEHLV
ncbi:MAG: ABC transporter ATP-binding protein [Caldilinea sp. CFX5]|nr:ABC transporter ATP-binding protein [Caldilinea sp. CFX5]